MAWSKANLPTPQKDAFLGDKPMFLAKSIGEDASVAWYGAVPPAATFVSTADTACTDSSYPTSLLHDRYLHLPSKPSAVAGATMYGAIFVVATLFDLDSIVLAGHNFPDVNGETTVRVFVADNSTFSSNREQIAEWIPATEGYARYVALDLRPSHSGHPDGSLPYTFGSVYSNVVYLQVVIESDEVITTLPEIGEVFIGPRRQLSAAPDEPWDDYHTESDRRDFVSNSGVATEYVQYQGQQIFTPSWSPTGTDLYSLDDVDTLWTWWAGDIGHGSKKFFFWPKPRTDIRAGYFCKTDSPAFQMPVQNVTRRIAATRFVESAPFYSAEEGT